MKILEELFGKKILFKKQSPDGRYRIEIYKVSPSSDIPGLEINELINLLIEDTKISSPELSERYRLIPLTASYAKKKGKNIESKSEVEDCYFINANTLDVVLNEIRKEAGEVKFFDTFKKEIYIKAVFCLSFSDCYDSHKLSKVVYDKRIL